MGRHVNCNFICCLVKNYYFEKQNHHKLCQCYNCKHLDVLLSEMERWSFYELNRFNNKWFIIFLRKFECQITLFPVFIRKMSKQIPIKYYSESESSREPYQATEDSAGYDLFAAETKTFVPNSVGTISLDLNFNSYWLFGKIISSFSTFKGILCYNRCWCN